MRLKVCFECQSPIEHKEGLRESFCFVQLDIVVVEYFLTLVLVPIYSSTIYGTNCTKRRCTTLFNMLNGTKEYRFPVWTSVLLGLCSTC